MPVKPCITCGELGAGSYCRRHQPSRVSPGRGGGATIRAYRKKALARDGHRCRALLPTGERCPVTVGLEVHHLVALADGGSHALQNLVTLCQPHHVQLERELRG